MSQYNADVWVNIFLFQTPFADVETNPTRLKLMCPGNAIATDHVPYHSMSTLGFTDSIDPSFSERRKAYYAEYILLDSHYMARGVRHQNAHVSK